MWILDILNLCEIMVFLKKCLDAVRIETEPQYIRHKQPIALHTRIRVSQADFNVPDTKRDGIYGTYGTRSTSVHKLSSFMDDDSTPCADLGENRYVGAAIQSMLVHPRLKKHHTTSIIIHQTISYLGNPLRITCSGNPL